MFRILTAVSVFMLAYAIPTLAAPITREEGGKIIAKGILSFFILAGIGLAIGLGFIYIIYKITSKAIFKTWFKEKAKYEIRKNPPKQTAPNTTEKPKYKSIDFKRK